MTVNRQLAEDDPRHGTPTGYRYWRCRCMPCTNAGSSRVLFPNSGVGDMLNLHGPRKLKGPVQAATDLTRAIKREPG